MLSPNHRPNSFNPQQVELLTVVTSMIGIFQMRFTLTAAAVATYATLAVQVSIAQGTEEGQRLFKQRCQSCHSVTPSKNSPAGPNLIGVIGRASGSTDFRYSAAMKNSGLTWDAGTLDQYLSAPAKLIPGTRMAVAVTNPQQRKAIVEYLATLNN